MDLVTWLWCYDYRWMFQTKTPNPDKIWLLPFGMNIFLIVSTVVVLFLQGQDLIKCIRDNGFYSWLQFQSVLLSFNCVLIVLMFFKIISIERKIEEKYSKLSIKERVREKYDFWVRNRGLLSPIGILLMISGAVQLGWVLHGWYLFDEITDPFCDNNKALKLTVLSNLTVQVLATLPVLFTFLLSVLFKGSTILFSWMFPNQFIRIKKCL